MPEPVSKFRAASYLLPGTLFLILLLISYDAGRKIISGAAIEPTELAEV
jgi:hypothetical protein